MQLRISLNCKQEAIRDCSELNGPLSEAVQPNGDDKIRRPHNRRFILTHPEHDVRCTMYI